MSPKPQFIAPLLSRIFSRKPSSFPKHIDESVSLGLDIGIGSCGYCIYKHTTANHNHEKDTDSMLGIRLLGVRTFDVPEDDKTKTPKNQERRGHRLMRRQTARRAERLRRARKLLTRYGLLPANYTPQSYDHHLKQPLQWRVAGLDHLLTPDQWACVLIHFIKHRGFKSNSKSDKTKGKKDGTLAAVRANHDALSSGGYRSFAEMLFNDPRFATRKRNTEDTYIATPLRADLENEIRLLFQKQRSLGNPHASEELEFEFLKIFNEQRPLQNSVHLVGNCPFLPDQKRCCLAAPSFELARALQKLNTLHLVLPNGQIVRLYDYLAQNNRNYTEFINQFGTTSKISWKKLRDIFQLDDSIHFRDLPFPKPTKKKTSATTPSRTPQNLREEAEKNDFVTATKDCAAATAKWRKVLGHLFEPLWANVLQGSLKPIDDAAFAIAFHETLEPLGQPGSPNHHKSIREALQELHLPPELLESILTDLRADDSLLADLKGTASLSSEACRRILPHLAHGKVYSEACAAAGFSHTDTELSLDEIRNPVVKSVIIEVMKQVLCVINEFGALPGTITLELARDLGKSIEERNEIQKAIKERTETKKTNRDAFAQHCNLSPDQISDTELLAYELYLEQSGLCVYSSQKLPPPDKILDALRNNHLQIDHILPFSRSFDDSYKNKVLVYTHCNQQKQNLTPYEWLASGNPLSPAWLEFSQKIQTLFPSLGKQKRRNLLNTTFTGSEDNFKARHLNDTRHIARLITRLLHALYEELGQRPGLAGQPRRVFAQPGELTAIVRRAWGLEHLKKDDLGQRLGDRHHALDALICACLSESHRQFITRQQKIQRALPGNIRDYFAELETAYTTTELHGRKEGVPRGLTPPCPHFLHTVENALEAITVSRRENRKGTGAFHDATIYSWRGKECDSQGRPIYYSRLSLTKTINGRPAFTKDTIEKIRAINDPCNAWLKQALEDWCQRGCPSDDLPRGPIPRTQRDNPAYTPPVVRRVWVRVGYLSARPSPHGAPQAHVTGGDLVRLDIFSKLTRQGRKEYHIVPIYTYHLNQPLPPNRAITAHKTEDQWTLITDDFTFEFSLWKNSLLKLIKADSQTIGYYNSCNRSTAAITLQSLNNSQITETISIKRGVLALEKWCIDRLGRLHRVPREERTWRGRTLTRHGKPLPAQP